MADNDLIRRGDALKALEWGDIYGRNAQDAIAALPAVPAWLSNCVVCGRIVDTRETDEGGDGHGCEYPEGWTCSSACAETLHPLPDWMKEGIGADAPAPDVAGLVEAAKRYRDARLAVDDTPEFCALVAALAAMEARNG
jgi:hypothetical protein